MLRRVSERIKARQARLLSPAQPAPAAAPAAAVANATVAAPAAVLAATPAAMLATAPAVAPSAPSREAAAASSAVQPAAESTAASAASADSAPDAPPAKRSRVEVAVPDDLDRPFREPKSKKDQEADKDDKPQTTRAIKKANLQKSWPEITQNDVRGDLPPQIKWLKGMRLGPTAASVGVPYDVSRVWSIRRGCFTPGTSPSHTFCDMHSLSLSFCRVASLVLL